MAYGFLSKPGTEYGPCRETCAHTDCAANRAMAAAPCFHCGEPIGYDVKLFIINPSESKYAHLKCTYKAMEEAEAKKEEARA